MSIIYNYKIISTDKLARCMDILYSAEGYEDVLVGARLPFEGEAIEDVISMFAPLQLWQLSKLSVVVPDVGTTGTIQPVPEASVATVANPNEVML